MYCSKCGAQNTDDSQFCNKCGAELTATLSNDAIKVQIEEARHLIEQNGRVFAACVIGSALFALIAVWIPEVEIMCIIFAILTAIAAIWKWQVTAKYSTKKANLIKMLK
jgi:uncharacterized membrane protein YvbJ